MNRRNFLKGTGVVAAAAVVGATANGYGYKRVDNIELPHKEDDWGDKAEPIVIDTPTFFVGLFDGDKEWHGDGYERQPFSFEYGEYGYTNAEQVTFATNTGEKKYADNIKIFDAEDHLILKIGLDRTAIHTDAKFSLIKGDLNISM